MSPVISFTRERGYSFPRVSGDEPYWLANCDCSS